MGNTPLVWGIQLPGRGILRAQDAVVKGGYGGGQCGEEDLAGMTIELGEGQNTESIVEVPTESGEEEDAKMGRHIEGEEERAGGRLGKILQEDSEEGATV